MDFLNFTNSLWYSFFMRFPIKARIFVTTSAACLIVLGLNALISRWEFKRSFIDYISEQELEMIWETAQSLAELHEVYHNWDFIKTDPRLFHDVLRSNRPARPSQPPNRRLAKPPRPPKKPGQGPRPRRAPPPRDPHGYGKRITLFDAQGEFVAGARNDYENVERVSVVVNGNTVGFISIAPQKHPTDQIDQAFLAKQERIIVMSAAMALIIAIIISALFASHLSRPIKLLTSGARAITGGKYNTRITETRKDELGVLAKELNILAKTLEKNRESRQSWVADIAHELRTPLTILRGELDSLEDGVRFFNDAIRQSLQNEVERLSNLVAELHELSAYEDGIHSFDFHILNPKKLLEKVIADAKHRITDQGIQIDMQLLQNPVKILGDMNKLERVFFNLIENSLRYTDSPGKLRVSLKLDSQNLFIEFSDSKPGVSNRDREKLFDRLFRVEDSRNRALGGSGLGLAICKAIIEAHGGMIVADDSDLGGLSIRIKLPLEK